MKPSYTILNRSRGRAEQEALEILSGRGEKGAGQPTARAVNEGVQVTVTWQDRDCLWGWDVSVEDITTSESARVGVGRTFRMTPCPGKGLVEIY
jgi:hypothetical protein